MVAGAVAARVEGALGLGHLVAREGTSEVVVDWGSGGLCWGRAVAGMAGVDGGGGSARDRGSGLTDRRTE